MHSTTHKQTVCRIEPNRQLTKRENKTENRRTREVWKTVIRDRERRSGGSARGTSDVRTRRFGPAAVARLIIRRRSEGRKRALRDRAHSMLPTRRRGRPAGERRHVWCLSVYFGASCMVCANSSPRPPPPPRLALAQLQSSPPAAAAAAAATAAVTGTRGRDDRQRSCRTKYTHLLSFHSTTHRQLHVLTSLRPASFLSTLHTNPFVVR